MLRTAIIGITGYGSEHLRLLLHGYEKGLLQPVAAVVINPWDAAAGMACLKDLGCRIYPSVEQMWDAESGGVDLCMIPSAIGTHYRFSRLALENGSHVFLEKPVCGTIQDANDLVRRAEAAGREICIGFQDLYNEQVQTTRKRILEGEFGRVLSVRTWGNWPRPKSYYTRNSWAGRLRDGEEWVLDSPVNNAMSHFLMLMLYWAGSDKEGFLQPDFLEGDLYRIQDIESFDTASLRLKTENGPSLLYTVSHSGERAVQPALLLEAESGTIRWSHCGTFQIDGPKGRECFPCTELSQIRERMIESIHDWIVRREAEVIPVRQAVLHTRIVNGLHQACPVETIPREEKREIRLRERDFVSMNGLVADLERSFTGNKLLCEVSPERFRAEPGQVALGALDHFSGPPEGVSAKSAGNATADAL
jgi:predicted dehydrogenase